MVPVTTNQPIVKKKHTINHHKIIIWLVVLTILNNISQWEGLFHISWKNKIHVPNHQPVINRWYKPFPNGWYPPTTLRR